MDGGRLQRFYRSEHDFIVESEAYGEDVYFNPEFVEVDRILDVRIVANEPVSDEDAQNDPDYAALASEECYGTCGRFTKQFLVKWRSIQYEEITWEIFADFRDETAIQKYYAHLFSRSLRILTSRRRVVDPHAASPHDRPPLTQFRKVNPEDLDTKGNQLRPYQVEGVNWMLWNWFNNRNSILADEMGLGKTVQSTLFIQQILYRYKTKPPFLIVAPLSTLPHWEAEIARWTDMHVVVFHGRVESRRIIKQYEWKSREGEFDILLTTFQICIAEAAALSSVSWAGLVVDEAHRLKGKNNKLGDVLKKIDFGCKLLLTGTPLQVGETNHELSVEQHGGTLDPAELLAAGAIQRRGPVPSGFRRYEGGCAAGEAAQRAEAADAATHEGRRREVAEAEGGDGDQRGDDGDAEEVLPRGVFYRAVYDHNTSVL